MVSALRTMALGGSESALRTMALGGSESGSSASPEMNPDDQNAYPEQHNDFADGGEEQFDDPHDYLHEAYSESAKVCSFGKSTACQSFSDVHHNTYHRSPTLTNAKRLF